jgi:hypothetical protein
MKEWNDLTELEKTKKYDLITKIQIISLILSIIALLISLSNVLIFI